MTEAATVKVGDTFYRSWGYDQTNVNFYEVVSVSKTGKTAKAKEVKAITVESSGYSDRVTAATGADRFVTEARCAKCQNYHWNGVSDDKRVGRGPGWDGHAYTDEYGWSAKTDKVTTDYDHAYRWDGAPKYQTAHGYGH